MQAPEEGLEPPTW